MPGVRASPLRDHSIDRRRRGESCLALTRSKLRVNAGSAYGA